MELTCVICGMTFQRPRRGGATPTICGSDECRRKRHADYERNMRWRKRGDAVTQTRICAECGRPFEFVRTEGLLGSGPAMCSAECRRISALRNTRQNQIAFRERLSPEERSRRRRVALLATYGLTSERYDEMVAAQGGVCAICKSPDTKHHSALLKIDHDRSCCPGNGSCGKCVRGLLCSNCNRGIGLFGDDPDVLRVAIDYLGRVLA